MFRVMLLSPVLACCLVQTVAAHGTAVQLSATQGVLNADRSHYVSDALFEAGSFLQSDLPGFEIAGPATGVPVGSAVRLRPAGKLWHWSAESRSVVDTSAVLAISNAAGEVREINDSEASVPPLEIAPYLGESPWHWHLDYFMAPLAAEPGAYAALFAPEATGLTAGTPFLLIFGLEGEGFGAADLPTAADALIAAVIGGPGRLAGDANLDGKVDLSDFGILKQHFGQSPTTWGEGDFDASGAVDLSDFGVLKENFGVATSARVPEPVAALLMVVGTIAAAMVRWLSGKAAG